MLSLSAKHMGEPYKCDTCGALFKNRHALTLHRDKIHLGKWFICHICGKELSDAKLLKGHKRRLHNE